MAKDDFPRLQVRSKFFFEGDEKFYLQGVTYGPFRPVEKGAPFLPSLEKVETDFKLMRDIGVNVLRVYHSPPTWFLDTAQKYRLRVLVTIPWHKRVLFLDDKQALHEIRQNVRRAAEQNAGHPALMGFFIDNEIPPDLVRWYGARRMQAFLDSLVALIKKADPGALAAYANFPPTEYLLPNDVDFYSYNVYLHRQRDLYNYLGRLQNLAGDKPLILSEFGMDTIRHPQEEQAELLTQHVTTVFQSGLAGTIIFSWTDEWFTDGIDVEDWAFGLVDKNRNPKVSYRALQPRLSHPERPLAERFPLPEMPKVSVVVCSYNGARTLEDCLKSLQNLHYPDYEVIFVDDGSKDNSQEIVKKFPSVRNIYQENKGLSVARNVGIAASTGEIVAFTDSDCMVDRDWLYFLVQTLRSGNFAAVGGPNISPPATNWVHATVGAAPGSPSHVLLTDTVAEHVPGCNMAYYKWVLDQIGGFDPEYRKAGDDVDVCWRIMQLGHQIGFSPAAVVWHYRRFEVKTYFSQQRGYGEAEALLRYKHLQYFDNSGSAIWKGHVYSQVRFDPFFGSRPIIYHGIFGTGLFQCLYQKPASPWPGLLSCLEWAALTFFIFLISIPIESLRLVPLIMFGLTLLVGLSYMVTARIETKYDSISSRLLLLYLAIMQPLVRGWARHFTWLRGKRTPAAVIKAREVDPHASSNWWSSGQLSFWSESGLDRTHLLQKIEELLETEGWKFSLDTGWTDWDIHVFASRWWNLRIRSLTEIYPHGRRLSRAGNLLHMSTFSFLVGFFSITFGLLIGLSFPKLWALILPAALISLGVWFYHGLSLRYRLAELIQVAAIRAGLQPVSKKN